MVFIKGLIKSFSLISSLCLVGLYLTGCASGAMKARKAERDRIEAQKVGVYCDYINGELFPDIEVQLNLEMAKRCDPAKGMTITNYKTPSENVGIMYCCSLGGGDHTKANPAADAKKDAKAKEDEELK
jgi:hypothetical protein